MNVHSLDDKLIYDIYESIQIIVDLEEFGITKYDIAGGFTEDLSNHLIIMEFLWTALI